ncbi:MAG: WxL domain-containing protein [Enterococcus sp.]|nr:WxL domain-containing protein [Enterococcus sp.]
MKSIRLLGATLLASTTLLGATGAFAAQSEPVDPNPATANTPITAELTLNQHPEKPTPPTGPDEGGDDQVTDIDGLFGIAYAPGAFSGSAELATSGVTNVSLVGKDDTKTKHNVGVQDLTRGKDRAWTLSAQLEWTGDNADYMAGSTITATSGNVKVNNKGTLTDVANGEVGLEANAESLTISQGSSVALMSATAGKTVNGVYNYQFENPTLVIPSSENVTQGQYTGNIVWSLTNALGN